MKKITPRHIAQVLFDLTDKKKSDEIELSVRDIAQLSEKHNMMSQIHQIVDEYYSIFNTHHNIQEVTVTLQERLALNRKNTLKEELKKILKCSDVYLIEKVDERIMGGIKIETRDGIYIDGTIQGRMRELRNALVK